MRWLRDRFTSSSVTNIELFFDLAEAPLTEMVDTPETVVAKITGPFSAASTHAPHSGRKFEPTTTTANYLHLEDAEPGGIWNVQKASRTACGQPSS